jgi:hypothetical protein
MLPKMQSVSWLEHGVALAPLVLSPSRRAWRPQPAARADLLRTPGFMSKSPPAVEAALGLAEQVVSRLTRGEALDGVLEQPAAQQSPSAAAYYRDGYDDLAARGRSLHRRAMELLRDA